MHVVREIGKADDEQLAAIQDGATRLLDDFEQFMGGYLIEALCLWREAAQKQQDRLALNGGSAEVQHLRPKQAS
jgi:hypothetical protein